LAAFWCSVSPLHWRSSSGEAEAEERRGRGGIWLAEEAHEVAGCVALRPWTNETAEMKRLYVRPEFQGRGIGRLLAERALAAAKEMNYRSINLDTLPSMKAAIELYRSLGFNEIERCNTNLVPGAMFFAKQR
jgi:putative acetyltransferase